MAWTEAVAGFTEFEIRLVKGDTKQSFTVGTYGAGAFQGTFADGFDRNKAIRVRSGPYSVLGSRQDKLYILSKHGGKVDLSETDATNCISLEIMDITNVPEARQLDKARGYGRYSPFASPSGLLIGSNTGITKEVKHIQNSKISTTTYIDMMGDSRFKLYDDDSATTSFDINSPLCKFSPNYSDVLVILPGSIFNVDVDTFGS